MPVAFNCVVAEVAVSKGRSLVWTKIFYGVEFSVHIVECKLRPVQQFNCRAAPRWNIFHATDRDELPLALRLFEVSEF